MYASNSKSHMCLNFDEAKSVWEAEMLSPSHAKLFPDIDWGVEAEQSDEDLESIETTITRVIITKSEFLTATILAKGPGNTPSTQKSFARRLVQQTAEAASHTGKSWEVVMHEDLVAIIKGHLSTDDDKDDKSKDKVDKEKKKKSKDDGDDKGKKKSKDKVAKPPRR